MIKHNGHVYVIEDETKRVKIGISREPQKRFRSIVHATGLSIARQYVTEELARYPELEKFLHEHFKDQRTNGEWFSIPFDEAVGYLKELDLSSYKIPYVQEDIPDKPEIPDIPSTLFAEEHLRFEERKALRKSKIDAITEQVVEPFYDSLPEYNSDFSNDDSIIITFGIPGMNNEIREVYALNKDITQEEINMLFLEYILKNTKATYGIVKHPALVKFHL